MMRCAFALLAALWLACAPAAALATPAAWGGVYGSGGIGALGSIGTLAGSGLGQVCGAGTQFVTTTKNVPQGALILLWSADAISGSHSVSDTVGNTYNVQSGSADSGGTRMRLWYSIAATALPAGDHITQTAGSGACYMAASAFTGITALSPFDQSDQNTNTGTSISLSSGTLTDPVEVVPAATYVNSGGGDTFSQAAGFTTDATVLDGNSVNALHSAYRIVITNASVTYAPNLGTSRVWNAQLGTLVGVQ